MGIYHAFIGIIEAILTVVVLMSLEKTQTRFISMEPDKTYAKQEHGGKSQ